MDINFEVIKRGVISEYWVDITDTIQYLMGDIVASAKMCMMHTDETIDESDIPVFQELISGQIRKLLESVKETNNFAFDEHKLDITFVNGKTVRFQSSEWCSMYGITEV